MISDLLMQLFLGESKFSKVWVKHILIKRKIKAISGIITVDSEKKSYNNLIQWRINSDYRS